MDSSARTNNADKEKSSVMASNDLNRCQLLGRLVADPELRFVQNDRAVLNFRVATSEQYEVNGEKRESAQFTNCALWGKRAEALAKFLAKGSRVYVEGRIETRSYEDKDGVKKYATDINVSDVKLLDGKKDSDGDRQDDRSNGGGERQQGRSSNGGGGYGGRSNNGGNGGGGNRQQSANGSQQRQGNGNGGGSRRPNFNRNEPPADDFGGDDGGGGGGSDDDIPFSPLRDPA